MTITKLPALGARRYYTRAVPGIWWVAGPLLSIVLVCASLGAMVAAYYADGVDRRQPERFYAGAESTVITPIWATRVMVWAEFATTAEEVADTVGLYEYVGMTSAFTGSFADGSPWVLDAAGDLRTYLRSEGDQLIVGIPVGSSERGGDRVSMIPEVVPSGYALGFDNSTFNALPLVFILAALSGVALFMSTMTPRRNAVELALEMQDAARKDASKRAQQAQESRRDRQYRQQSRVFYEQQLAEWRKRNDYALRQGIDPGGAPVSPDAGAGGGLYLVLMVGVVLAGPLWGLFVAATAGVQALNSQIAGNSLLTVLLPLMGDTPWRVFVMSTTALLVASVPPVLGVILSWRVDRPGLRKAAVIATLVLLAAMLLFVIIGTTLPLDRAIR